MMFTVDPALRRFQAFICSGYALGPFVVVFIALKKWHSLELFITESKGGYLDILTEFRRSESCGKAIYFWNIVDIFSVIN